MIVSVVAVLMVHESPVHLLIVPFYRLIYEPLRAYVVFGSAVRALRGSAYGWYKPQRTNSAALPPSDAGPRPLSPTSA